MRTIHCIAFDPANDGGVGGVEWRVQHEAAQKLYLTLQQDADYDNCRITYFEVRVPDWASNKEITELVDEKAYAEDYVPIMRRDAREAVA